MYYQVIGANFDAQLVTRDGVVQRNGTTKELEWAINAMIGGIIDFARKRRYRVIVRERLVCRESFDIPLYVGHDRPIDEEAILARDVLEEIRTL